ncbi:MAG: beta-N-acetylhexosaminidase, partial [Lachnospiraceae bacterium]|nr:beta-N-acetylhexosaminidase [Lachnospiraceae bacterium]
MKELLFIPKPERVDYSGQSFPAPDRWTVCLPQGLQEMADGLRRLWTEPAIASDGQETEGAGCISFYHEEGLPEEGYRLEITGERTVIGYGNVKGAYYAMVTLHQAVLQSDGMIPCCRIVDGPALSLRGVLVDISRGKVPRLETLKRLADLLASLKYNHLELYIEGFSYGYRSHPQVWREDACLLAEEVRELADYCRECFIELVPQQNSLGHMAGWLTLPEYRGLAETEEGLAVM